MSVQEILAISADKLSKQAESIKSAHTVQGEWLEDGYNARVEHEELLRLAYYLRAMLT